MVCNAETKKALKRISGFICDNGTDRIEYKVMYTCGVSVYKAIAESLDGKSSALVRWERGRGWREAGTGNGGNQKTKWYPILK